MSILLSTGELADAQAKANVAMSGDTIALLGGTFTWTAALVLPSINISVLGAGSTLTHVIRNTTGNDSARAILAVVSSTSFVDISGINFTTVNPAASGLIGVGTPDCQGDPKVAFRIHHCSFTYTPATGSGGRAINTIGCYGLIDHNIFTTTADSGGQVITIDRDQSVSTSNTYHTAITLGDRNAIYMEDNVFNCFGPNDGCFDAYEGTRLVFRHNTVVNAGLGWHGLDSPTRSTRTFEIYENTFTTNKTSCVGMLANTCRGGTGVVFNNSWANFAGTDASHGYLPGGFLVLKYYAAICPADMALNSDNNRGTPIYYPVAPWGSIPATAITSIASGKLTGDQLFDGNQFGPQSMDADFTRTVTDCVRNGTTTITSATANFVEADKYKLIFGTGIAFPAPVTTASPRIVTVNSSTSVTLNVVPTGGSGSGGTLTIGCSNQGYPGLDQPGRGSFPISNPGSWPTKTTGYNDSEFEALDPIYQWGNTYLGDAAPTCTVGTRGAEGIIKRNRDYYDNTARPGYTPYTYPHPLSTADIPPVPGDVVAPVITSAFSNRTVAKKSNATLAVTATGDNLKYKWKKCSVVLSGAIGPSYSIVKANASHAGTYAVTVSNAAGSVTASATVTVK